MKQKYLIKSYTVTTDENGFFTIPVENGKTFLQFYEGFRKTSLMPTPDQWREFNLYPKGTNDIFKSPIFVTPEMHPELINAIEKRFNSKTIFMHPNLQPNVELTYRVIIFL